MRVFMMIAALLLLLAACSGQPESQGTPKTGDQKDPPAQQDQNDNKETEEDQSKGEDTAKGESKKDDKQMDEDKGDQEKEKPKKEEPVKPKYVMNENYYIDPIDNADPKVVLLTIDDAPDEHAVEMAKTLKKLHAPAIFFIMGTFIDNKEGKKEIKKIHEMGFPVGNHTITHPTLSQISKEEQREEIVPLYEELKDLTGEPVKFFRAPHGDNTELSDKLAAERDVLVMNWSYGYDWHEKYQDPEALTQIMLHPDPEGLLRDGAILLLHDRDWTAKALDDIVKGLREMGYTLLDPALLKTPQSGK
ncbi:MAG TPA: polysaccharide deacetylase family protein [Bacillales bacterium]|nr:polysaccharide deacetylase family protein [Bacillales bacterium]